MKSLIIALAMLVCLSPAESPKLKPYILGTRYLGSIASVVDVTKAHLKAEGFDIVGEYSPANDANKKVICVSCKELRNSAASIGGLTGLAAVLRVGIIATNNEIHVSYTNPYYWGNAYYRSDYQKVENNYKIVNNMFIAAMKKGGTYTGKYYGSEEGIEAEDLHSYQYMVGMPEFDDIVELKTFASYADAVKKVDANLAIANKNYRKVYEQSIPGKNLKVYGIALTGSTGESLFINKIDISANKHVAFMPYEILIKDKTVIMLHGRYRIALSFPDLTMSTFTKIMSTPGDIENVMKEICK